MTVPYSQTREFRKFGSNVEYARRMVLAGQSLADARLPAVDADDFYRAAWVQAVGAIDHWFHEELYRRVTELAEQDDGHGIPHRLARLELPLPRVEDVRRGTMTLADAVTAQVRARWAGVSLQNPREISEAMKLVTEKDIWSEAATRINEWNYGHTSHTSQSLKRKYVSITGRRNRIAHDADLLDEDLGRRRPIAEADVTDAINWVERIAHAVATVLD